MTILTMDLSLSFEYFPKLNSFAIRVPVNNHTGDFLSYTYISRDNEKYNFVFEQVLLTAHDSFGIRFKD